MQYWTTNRRCIMHVEPRKDWAEPVELWIDWLKALGRTDDTLRTRWYQISQFSRIVDKPIADVTEDDLIFYLAGMGTEAKRGMRSCVKVFYQWAVRHELAVLNPADDVPSVPMTLPSGLICPEESIEQGLASPDRDARLAVMLGAFCGLRRIEMTRINLANDIESAEDGKLLHIHGKGNKERTLPIPSKLAIALAQRDGTWLFPGAVGGHCGVDYVAKRIKTATGYPSHSLRRRFATAAYYRNGCNIVLVSRMLGHANIATTMRYIGLVQDEMRNAVESAARTDSSLTISTNQIVGAGIATYSLSTARIG
ncbi:Integrase [Bifidobacterium saguini DSM 23967]|uniref:Integrase n=2 Tax=Bifidobacterium saguini TaxID=762210 RepID=A0A087DAH5_9BIFI|nr:tyrosine-type recombinase/integrase [Bifidobacterium saguini]KFI92525.1 Integrase [Bifidobacterium saguini DSM 23967]QTB90754.1 tyrosine-type recombinase/integrase [Bifidobacterium saguini]